MVYVFKTSVKFKKQVKALKPYLDKALPPGTWNFDLEDCDKIFRVDAGQEATTHAVHVLSQHGFACEELA